MSDGVLGLFGLGFARRQVKNALDAAAKIVSDECDSQEAQSSDVTQKDVEFAVLWLWNDSTFSLFQWLV